MTGSPRSPAEAAVFAELTGACTLGLRDGPCPSCKYAHALRELRPACGACGATDLTVTLLTADGDRVCRACLRKAGRRC